MHQLFHPCGGKAKSVGSVLTPKRRAGQHKLKTSGSTAEPNNLRQAVRLQSQTNGMRIAGPTVRSETPLFGALVAGHERDVHTIAIGDGWINKVGGIQVDGLHRTQEAAIEAGRILATKNQSEHAIHGKDGKIGEQNSYGYDSRDIRG